MQKGKVWISITFIALLLSYFDEPSEIHIFFKTANASEVAATVLMYHRFGESAFPSTNIRIKQFEAHLNELKTKCLEHS